MGHMYNPTYYGSSIPLTALSMDSVYKWHQLSNRYSEQKPGNQPRLFLFTTHIQLVFQFILLIKYLSKAYSSLAYQLLYPYHMQTFNISPNQCSSFCTSLPHTILARFQSILQFKPGWSKIYISDHLSFLFIILQWSPLVYRIKYKLNKTNPQGTHILFADYLFATVDNVGKKNKSRCPGWMDLWYKVSYTLSGFWVLNQITQREKNVLAPTHSDRQLSSSCCLEFAAAPDSISKPSFQLSRQYYEPLIFPINPFCLH